MDSLAKSFKYHTQIEKPVDPTTVLMNMLGYSKKRELSPRQMDMLNYHTSIEQPSFIDTLKVALGVDKGSCSPQSVSFSNDEPAIIPEMMKFSISEIQ